MSRRSDRLVKYADSELPEMVSGSRATAVAGRRIVSALLLIEAAIRAETKAANRRHREALAK